MKIVDLKCPNCSGSLTKEWDNLICSSCGAAFAIDYDDSDVEYEKLQSEAEREERRLAHEKELLEKEYELKRQAEIDAENMIVAQGQQSPRTYQGNCLSRQILPAQRKEKRQLR